MHCVLLSPHLSTRLCKSLIVLHRGNGRRATHFWGLQEELYELYTGDANVYNWCVICCLYITIVLYCASSSRYFHYTYDPDITALMNGTHSEEAGAPDLQRKLYVTLLHRASFQQTLLGNKKDPPGLFSLVKRLHESLPSLS